MSHFYLGSLRKCIVQFASIFNDIEIAKYDKAGNVLKYITVPVKFAPKDKMYQYINDSSRPRPLPLIAIQLYGINHDPMRIGNKSQYLTVSKDTAAGTSVRYLNPVPYNLDFQVTIVGNYMVEVDQILEQLLSYFNPFVFMRIKLDSMGDQDFEVKVTYTSATPDTNTDMAEQEMRIISWTLYFTAYTYFWTPVDTEAITKKIITKYYTTPESWAHQGTETSFTSGASGSYESEAHFLKAIGYTDGELDFEDHLFSVEEHQ
jgi:hypothetical protein